MNYCISDFEILAFPCNQFLSQEPGTSQEAEQFACTRFKAEYPIFQKVRGFILSHIIEFIMLFLIEVMRLIELLTLILFDGLSFITLFIQGIWRFHGCSLKKIQFLCVYLELTEVLGNKVRNEQWHSSLLQENRVVNMEYGFYLLAGWVKCSSAWPYIIDCNA